MSDNKITRETLDIIMNIEGDLNRFHGLRSLWADTVANYADKGLSADELMADQRRALWGAIGHAMALSQDLWPGQSPHTAFESTHEAVADDINEMAGMAIPPKSVRPARIIVGEDD